MPFSKKTWIISDSLVERKGRFLPFLRKVVAIKALFAGLFLWLFQVRPKPDKKSRKADLFFVISAEGKFVKNRFFYIKTLVFGLFPPYYRGHYLVAEFGWI